MQANFSERHVVSRENLEVGSTRWTLETKAAESGDPETGSFRMVFYRTFRIESGP